MYESLLSLSTGLSLQSLFWLDVKIDHLLCLYPQHQHTMHDGWFFWFDIQSHRHKCWNAKCCTGIGPVNCECSQKQWVSPSSLLSNTAYTHLLSNTAESVLVTFSCSAIFPFTRNLSFLQGFSCSWVLTSTYLTLILFQMINKWCSRH